MALTVEIAGVDRTAETWREDQGGSITVSMSLSSDWTAEFTLYDLDSTVAAYRPALGDDVLIEDGATAVFHGTIVEIEDGPLENTGTGTRSVVRARAFTALTDRIIIDDIYPQKAVYIVSSNASTPVAVTLTTSEAHGAVAGDQVQILGHTGSTPAISGNYVVASVPTPTTFTIGVVTTVGGTGGGVRVIVTDRDLSLLPPPELVIANSSIANPSSITTTQPHYLVTGMTVRIQGHESSTPDINGDHVITVTSATTFTIPVNVTAAGGGGNVIPLTTMKDLVEFLHAKYLNSEGVTIDTLDTGPLLTRQTFPDVTLREAFNHISVITGELWRIHPSDQLQFFTPGDKTASYSLTSSNRLSVGAVTFTQSRDQYANRVVLRYGTEMQRSQTHYMTGDGSTTSFPLDYRPAFNSDGYITSQGYVTDNGVFYPLEATVGGVTWSWNAGTNALTRSPALPNEQRASFIYTVQYPQTETAEDATAITNEGLYSVVENAPKVFNKTEAAELAAALLRRYLEEPKTVGIATRNGFVLPGDSITLTFTARGISGSYVIRDVRASDYKMGSTKPLHYALTCLEGTEIKETWLNRLRQSLGGGSSPSRATGGMISGSAVPNFSGRFSEDVVAHSGIAQKEVILGDIPSLGSYAGGPGMWMNRNPDTAAGRGSWAILTDQASGDQALLFQDRSQAAVAAYSFRVDVSGTNAYTLHPATGVSLYIGGNGLNRVTSVDSTNGYFERGRSVALGAWQSQSFSAGNFTSDSGSWTVASGDVTVNRYMLIGKTLWWHLEIQTSSVSGTPGSLRATLPGGFTVQQGSTAQPCRVVDNGGSAAWGLAIPTGSATYVDFRSAVSGAGWATSTDATSIQAFIVMEIQ